MNDQNASLSTIERLLDLELPVSIALGHADLTIQDALKMKSGSVVQLNKEDGGEVDLLVQGTLVARGQIVLVDDNYGVRITQILNRALQPAPMAAEGRLR